MELVGASVVRPDAVEKVKGQAVYVGDLEIPGMVYGKVLASPFPHAKITRLDASRARRLRGVVGVLTGDELHNMEPYYGSDIKDRPIVALEKVRFQGEPVAVVAAEDLATAEEALELIQVEYEELPSVLDSREAAAEGAPILHDEFRKPKRSYGDLSTLNSIPNSNIGYHFKLRRGDVDQDGDVTISDAQAIVSYLFGHGDTPACQKSSDANDNGATTVTDAVEILFYLFRSGDTLPSPFAQCGSDGTDDQLSCETFVLCL